MSWRNKTSQNSR